MITGIDFLVSVLLLASVYVPFHKTFMFSLSNFHHLSRSVLTANTHKHTGRLFCTHTCTHMHMYTLTYPRGNLRICRSTCLFSRHMNSGRHPTFFVLVVFFHLLIDHLRLHF